MGATRFAGGSLPRVDGRLKVTGAAAYASDLPLPGAAHAALATSAVARGRITGIDAAEAEAAPGVIGVFTHRDFAGLVRPVGYVMRGGYANSTLPPLDGPELRHHGQIVALAVAETAEAAAEAAARIRFSYAAEPAEARLDLATAEPEPLAALSPEHKDVKLGDADGALAASNVAVDGRYATAIQHHNPMELFSTAAAWDGDRLTVHEASKYVGAVRFGLAEQLGISPDKVRVLCPLVGGHFGSKFGLSQHTALVALAARRLGRPVSLVPTRRDCFTIATHRPETRHRVALAADADGRLRALVHEAVLATSRFDDFAMEGTDVTSALYACPNIRTREEVLRVDRNTPGPMRAPPEVPYLFALESAMDELAAALGLDPIELRRRNEARTRSKDGAPFTTHPLMRCFAEGARRFGWHRRAAPGASRDGDWLVGLGCASAVRPVKTAPSVVRVAVEGDGSALVETAHHEIGQGLATVLTQLAADGLGLPPGRIRVRLGDTDLPPAGVSGASSTTTALAPAVERACAALRLALGRAAAAGSGPLRGVDPAALTLADGVLRAPDGRFEPLGRIAAAAPGGRVGVVHEHLPEGMKPGALADLKRGKAALGKPPALAWAFGAQFAEVRVHALTGEIRAERLLGAFAAGRILNPRLARAQLVGGMVGGLGGTLLEASVVDGRTGAYVDRDLAEYLLPVSADVPSVEAVLLDDDDPEANEAGVKGVGELGIIGVNAAIANAVFNATGARHRELPIRLGDTPG